MTKLVDVVTDEMSPAEESSSECDDGRSDLQRAKRQKVECTINPLPMCKHPGFYAGMCIKCGLRADDHSAIPLKYIDKNLRLATDEMTRLRDKDFKNLLHRRKLYLVLDLDHTLLHSARLTHIKGEEAYLKSHTDALPDSLKSSLFRLDNERMIKLRPFVHSFLEEASKLFEMYIYTMADRAYALKMAELLDPGNKYFHSRIIAHDDCTHKNQKGLDIVLGRESAVLILDDKEKVWKENMDNLILMDKYYFFPSSCGYKSFSPLKSDESETEGALATVLKVLQRVHSLFFDKERKDNLENRDVRQVLKSVRKEVLKGCKIVFARMPAAKLYPLWRMALQLGATCSARVDPCATHVVSKDAETDKAVWAIMENKYLVSKGWLEASYLLWRKQPEQNFPVDCEFTSNLCFLG